VDDVELAFRVQAGERPQRPPVPQRCDLRHERGDARHVEPGRVRLGQQVAGRRVLDRVGAGDHLVAGARLLAGDVRRAGDDGDLVAVLVEGQRGRERPVAAQLAGRVRAGDDRAGRLVRPDRRDLGVRAAFEHDEAVRGELGHARRQRPIDAAMRGTVTTAAGQLPVEPQRLDQPEAPIDIGAAQIVGGRERTVREQLHQHRGLSDSTRSSQQCGSLAGRDDCDVQRDPAAPAGPPQYRVVHQHLPGE